MRSLLVGLRSFFQPREEEYSMAKPYLGVIAAACLAAGSLTLAGCGSSAPAFSVGSCINWSIGSDGSQVPLKVSCSNLPDPDIDLVKAIAASGQSCAVGDRFYTQSDGSTLCLEDEYVMSPSG
jgi:hypothetical protein